MEMSWRLASGLGDQNADELPGMMNWASFDLKISRDYMQRAKDCQEFAHPEGKRIIVASAFEKRTLNKDNAELQGKARY